MFFEQVLILFVVPFAGIPQSIHVFFNTFREDGHQGASDFRSRQKQGVFCNAFSDIERKINNKAI